MNRLRLWRALLVLLMAAVLVLALMPAPPRSIDTGWDKLNHMLAFGTLAVAGRFGFPGARTPLWLLIGGLLGFGVLIELLQMLVPTRSAEVADVLADSVGIAVGLAVHWCSVVMARVRRA